MKDPFNLFFAICILIIFSVSLTGAVIITEGDSILKTDQVREKYKVNGTGVRIGVISNGVDNLADVQTAGELPRNVVVLSNTRGGVEGTQMLQIIHDIAPGATLFFHDYGGSPQQFNDAIDALLKMNCSIIVDDVGWIKLPVYEDGVTALHVKNALLKNKDLVFISSAGNNALEHYHGMYYKTGATLHDFSQGTSERKNMYVRIPGGGKVQVVLKWDDKYGKSNNDYDLYLIDYSTKELIEKSENKQEGNSDPFEYIRWINTGTTPVYAEVLVKNHNGLAKPRNLDVIVLTTPGTDVGRENIVTEDSIYGHSAIPEVITVAAVSANDPQLNEPFSSQGPVTIMFPMNDTRKKPDIAGIDAVNVYGEAGNKELFSGTSAAAPHIAGLLALVKSAYPEKTPTEIRKALYESSVDLGSKGWDPVFGGGRADAVSLFTMFGEPKNPLKITNLNISPIITKKPVTTQRDSDNGFIPVRGSIVITSPGKYRLLDDIHESGRDTVIDIQSSDVTFDGNGHFIEGVSAGDDKPAYKVAVWVQKSGATLSGVTIKNLKVVSWDWGIASSNVSGIKIENCNFENNFAGSISVNSEGAVFSQNNFRHNYFGLFIGPANTLQVKNNSFINNRGGLYTIDTTAADIKWNQIRGNEQGAVLSNSKDIRFNENICSNNEKDAIILRNSEGIEILGNTLSDNGYDGIMLSNSSRITIKSNTASGNLFSGLWLEGSSLNTVIQNVISKNRVGITLIKSDKNSFSANRVSGNDVGLVINSSSMNTFTKDIYENELEIEKSGLSQNNLKDNNPLPD